jgi:hypothetical protein
MSTTATSPAPSSPVTATTDLESQYKPVGIAALNAATQCKGTSRPAKTGK